MNRRSFIALSSVLPFIPITSYASGYRYESLFKHFSYDEHPKVITLVQTTENHIRLPDYNGQFVMFVFSKPGRIFSSHNAIINHDKDKVSDSIFEDLTELEVGNHIQNWNKVVIASNKICWTTERGAGNKYFVDDKDIIVWYDNKETSVLDVPITINPHFFSYAKNPNFSKYFLRIKNTSLSKFDHNLLQNKVGMKRII